MRSSVQIYQLSLVLQLDDGYGHSVGSQAALAMVAEDLVRKRPFSRRLYSIDGLWLSQVILYCVDGALSFCGQRLSTVSGSIGQLASPISIPRMETA